MNQDFVTKPNEDTSKNGTYYNILNGSYNNVSFLFLEWHFLTNYEL